MKRYIVKLLISCAWLPMMLLSSCHDEPEYHNTITDNFEALVDLIDTRYCFLDEKDLDWKETAELYRQLIDKETNQLDLFYICAALLDELKDGHVNLSSRFDTSYYRKWWTDYPQNFNLRTIQEYYLDFDWFSINGISFKMLDDEIGYIYYPSFSYYISDITLDYILAILSSSKALIIDIRNNGGGDLTNINTIVARFIDKEFTGGYIKHKTGPGHNNFSEPYPIVYKPADSEYHIMCKKPVAVLTNRSCFSAANSFASVMKQLPNVSIIGAKTGGGGGLPFSSELPIGWAVRFSACPILDANMESIENGIMPTPGCEIDASEEELAEGKDAIIDFAITLLKDKVNSDSDI